ncbi:hypothetical protein BEP19_16195 [Ammoniphilus oxalaticus]|uniref:Glycoside hydrolase n=1 Tax=Ammoniphilus oxalaticus TaxID=66863 RepID=A0A419SQM5_9BACL|nr:S-layer homology domain-containing protein [Ammoniphilus oxalaticus]RKD26741.1 hypothetical protein BEP19_16195 [Ammoniphilus oxalaticus]
MKWKRWARALLAVGLVAASGSGSVFATSNDPANNHGNMIYLYGGNSNTYKQQLTKTQGQVGTLLPNYFGLTKEGRLTEAVDADFVKYAHQHHYRITPFISNHWDRALGVKAMENGDKLADDLAQAVIKHNLDGVNIDIENLTFEQRDLQTKFLTRLTNQLRPLGKTVSIAVAPARSDTTVGWAGSYDFEAIGKVVDTVFIMAYDQSYQQGPEGPVAGLNWVEQSVKYLTTKIPKEKLVLGVPFYGRYWTGAEKGTGIIYPQTMKWIERNNAKTNLDPTHQTHVSRFYDQESGQQVEIWFDSANTLLKKVELVEKYGLKGWGGWRLGQEDPALWSALAEVDHLLFKDINDHWAKQEIQQMVEQKFITGYADGSFRPQLPISREETATLLTTILKLDQTKPTTSYKDVAKDRWSHPFVSAVSENGTMTGYPDKTFRPTQSITRAEFASALARITPASNASSAINVSFPDVDGHWAAKAIQQMQQAGIIAGYEDGSFRPNQTVTRAEAAVMLSKLN